MMNKLAWLGRMWFMGTLNTTTNFISTTQCAIEKPSDDVKPKKYIFFRCFPVSSYQFHVCIITWNYRVEYCWRKMKLSVIFILNFCFEGRWDRLRYEEIFPSRPRPTSNTTTSSTPHVEKMIIQSVFIRVFHRWHENGQLFCSYMLMNVCCFFPLIIRSEMSSLRADGVSHVVMRIHTWFLSKSRGDFFSNY